MIPEGELRDTASQGLAADPSTAPQPLPADLPGRPSSAAVVGGMMRTLKGLGLAMSLAAVAPAAALCWAESRLTRRSEFFLFWGQAFALVPGMPGKYLRKCFYHLTLRRCSLSCDLGFMSYFNDRRAEVGRRVYVGYGVCIGTANLGDGCLIGSRASILSGGAQHRLDVDGRLTPFDPASARVVLIGEETWIGEAAVLMSDVGDRCIVAAGSVVSSPVPTGCMVGGNPARFIRKLI